MRKILDCFSNYYLETVEISILIGISFLGEQSQLMNLGLRTYLNLEMKSTKQIVYSLVKISFKNLTKILSYDSAKLGLKPQAREEKRCLVSGEYNSSFHH